MNMIVFYFIKKKTLTWLDTIYKMKFQKHNFIINVNLIVIQNSILIHMF